MPNCNLTLVIQGLPPLTDAPKKSRNLFNYFREIKHHQKNLTQILFRLFEMTVPEEAPVAATTALVYQLPAQQDWWLRADPVILQPDLAGLYMLGGEQLDLGTVEVQQIIAELNQFLINDGMQLYAPDATHWYLKVTEDPQIITHDPELILGKEIGAYLPVGNKQAKWRRLMTEIQMLLHSCQVNQQRQIEGKPVISSLWLWGGGCLPIAKKTSWRKVWSNGLLAQGLAQLTQTPLVCGQVNVTSCLTQLRDDGDYLIVIDLSRERQIGSDSNLDAAFISSLQQVWLAPLAAAIRNKKLARVTLYLDNGIEYQLVAEYLPWWRRILNCW